MYNMLCLLERLQCYKHVYKPLIQKMQWKHSAKKVAFISEVLWCELFSRRPFWHLYFSHYRWEGWAMGWPQCRREMPLCLSPGNRQNLALNMWRARTHRRASLRWGVKHRWRTPCIFLRLYGSSEEPEECWNRRSEWQEYWRGPWNPPDLGGPFHKCGCLYKTFLPMVEHHRNSGQWYFCHKNSGEKCW